VPDSEAIRYARLLARQEGILAGISSGATACAAVELARKMESGRIVFIVGDRGERYFSTPLFDEARQEK
jgi:cysteine synthase